jgi:hypothetical protein
MDNYVKTLLPIIKSAKTDDELARVIDKIYEDGFADGVEDARFNN